MSFVYRAAILAIVTFASALVGFGVRLLLPATYVAESSGMIGSLVGLVATLLALVLGLLIWTSHGVFTAQQSQLELIAHSIARLHFKLKAYGAEATSADALLYQQALRARARFWAEDARGRDDVPYADVPAGGMAMRVALTSLRPTSDEQRQHLAAAKELCNTVFETQLTMLRSLVNPVPSLLLNVVLSWSCILFFSYGLLSVINALTAIMAALGAAAVGSAAFLILELSDPYSGLFRMSPAGFDRLTQLISAGAEKKTPSSE